ncbi:MAG: AMP-binding protein [Marinilabiliaceae bacterium]|nr:AMP-binding protein [Marinilabiliaceae bacterium]
MKNLIDLFEDSVFNFPNNTFLWEKKDKQFESTTYKKAHELVNTFALGLLQLGIKPNDKVSLLSEGRNDWLISELAILINGAISVPLSTKLDADIDLIFRINHSDSKFIITSKQQLIKVRKIANQIPNIEKIIVLDLLTDLKSNEIYKKDIDELGKKASDVQINELKKRRQNINCNQVATISYTSGTTADPKGIMLTHRNYTANIEQAFSYIEIPQHYITLAVLPWDHAFAHTASLYSFMHKGASIASVQVGGNQLETLKNFSNNMLEIKPHVLMSVPAIAKNFRKNIEKGIISKGSFTWHLFNLGLKTSNFYIGNGANKAKGLRLLAKPLHLLFDKIIYQKIKEKFGGNLKFFIGGGALLDSDLQRFFFALGVPMYQGYGLTEAAPIISANTPTFHIIGTSGKVVNNLDIKICDENGNALPIGKQGEIVIKGENVMAGYWKNEEASREVLKEGWLYTGDMGYLQKNNYLNVLGRFKSLLISSDGEKYSPEGIEEGLIDHLPWLDQIMLHNNQNPYTIALLVLNKEFCKSYINQHNLDITNDNDINKLIHHFQHDLAQYKKGGKHHNLFPHRWLPSVYIILDEAFTEENKLVNSTMKIVRGKIETYHKKMIEFAYTPEAKNISNSTNIKNIRRFFS